MKTNNEERDFPGLERDFPSQYLTMDNLTPRHLHEERRKEDILSAMKRYSEEGKAIPTEWLDELTELIYKT